ACLTLAASATSLAGQSTARVDPRFSSWTFRDPLPSDSLSIKRASQFALPVNAAVRAGRLELAAGASYAVSRVGLADGRSLDLSGFTDLRLRGVFHVVGDNLLLTFGLTAPTGTSRLAGGEVDALGVIGATSLGFAVPALGSGFGGTAGAVVA